MSGLKRLVCRRPSTSEAPVRYQAGLCRILVEEVAQGLVYFRDPRPPPPPQVGIIDQYSTGIRSFVTDAVGS